MPPNDRHQRWEPAARDGRLVSKLNGWLPSAAWCGWAVRVVVYLFVPSSKPILLMLLPVGVTMQRSTLPTLSNTDRISGSVFVLSTQNCSISGQLDSSAWYSISNASQPAP